MCVLNQARRRFPRWVAVLTAMLMIAVLTGLFAVGPGRDWVLRVDRELLNERLKDSLAQLRTGEDWATAMPLRMVQDYSWRQTGGNQVRIAHALGDASLRTSNTLGAMRNSYLMGLRIFEVDLVFEEGELRCQHDPGPQLGMVQDGCRFGSLLDALPKDAWLVLDIKTDFVRTGQRIVDQLKMRQDAHRVIFQLYRPEDLAVFNRWQEQLALPGPILTAYLSPRRIDHVATHASRLGFEVLTLPLERLPALQERPQDLALFVHPVHHCGALAAAIGARVDGVYMVSSLNCAKDSTRSGLNEYQFSG